jgi:hypothetical protein
MKGLFFKVKDGLGPHLYGFFRISKSGADTANEVAETMIGHWNPEYLGKFNCPAIPDRRVVAVFLQGKTLTIIK